MKKYINKIRIMCLSLAVFCVFSHVSMVADASGTSGSTSSVTITYNNSESGLTWGNTYLPWNWNSESTHFEVNLDDTSVFWYKGKQVSLFTSSADYYGYYIQVTRSSNTTNTSEYAQQKFWCVGTAGQLMQGENRGGTITSTSFTAWVPTNHSVQAVHMAPFYQFYHDYDYAYENDVHVPTAISGSYSINAKYTVKYTGYKTVADYNSAMTNIQNELKDQTTELEGINSGIGDLNIGIDNLQNGFNSSSGDSMNDNFSDTVNSYVDTENTLFTSAKSGLDSFEFTDIGSTPGLVTAMSLVGSMMASAYRSMSLTSSGSGGLAQLVLSILFSVMLVSMALGLYHYYQNKKGG